MGFGKSFKKTVGKTVSQLPGGDTRLGGYVYGAALGSLLGPAGGAGLIAATLGGGALGFQAGKYGSEYKKPDGTPLTQQEVNQINTANLFANLTPTEQKDLLLNNPNIITPEGGQTYDPYTNTISINESEFTKNQRLQQERLADELARSLSGTMPSTDNELVRQTTFDLGMRQLQPQLKNQRDALATQLANQGIPINSEAYNSAMNRLDQAQASQLNELSMQSVLQGIQVAEAQRSARFNEISSLLGRSQVGTGANFGMFQPNYQGLDLMGAEQAQLNRQASMDMARMQNRAATTAAKWQAGGQVIGAGIGALGNYYGSRR